MEAFNQAESVKKVKILHDEWMPDSEELTPTMKLKRRGIYAKYAREIECPLLALDVAPEAREGRRERVG